MMERRAVVGKTRTKYENNDQIILSKIAKKIDNKGKYIFLISDG